MLFKERFNMDEAEGFECKPAALLPTEDLMWPVVCH